MDRLYRTIRIMDGCLDQKGNIYVFEKKIIFYIWKIKI